MDNVLQRLLNAELKAQDVVEQAKLSRDRLISETRAEVKRAEQRFEARIPDIHASFSNKAQERATTHIKELERRYLERQALLLDEAEQHHDEAVQQVLALLLDVQQN
jgi:vacuolar-type H+-ATPase subunit H